MPDATVRAFLSDPVVASALADTDGAKSTAEWVGIAAGAPGELFGNESKSRSIAAARKLIDAALSPRESARHAATLSIGGAGARGSYADVLDSLLVLIGERMRAALHDSDARRALGASRAADAVARAAEQADGNVNPQLITARLLRELSSNLS